MEPPTSPWIGVGGLARSYQEPSCVSCRRRRRKGVVRVIGRGEKHSVRWGGEALLRECTDTPNRVHPLLSLPRFHVSVPDLSFSM